MQTCHDPLPFGMCYWEILTVVFALLCYLQHLVQQLRLFPRRLIQYVLPAAFLVRTHLSAIAYPKRCCRHAMATVLLACFLPSR